MAAPRGRPAVTGGDLRSPCPIAACLDFIGDTWTLLVIRDLLFYDKHRFADFLGSPERISTNILAERLKRLEERGLLERRRYQERPPRDEYYLTAKGYDLLPILQEMIKWGQMYVDGTAKRPPAGFVGIAPRPASGESR
ncbi:MAG TPA: helix-turn-helix domain-containing protein [Vicinamibacterales bacterium]|jgi:DNA-binding HxlR family transcriptional regulator|nr:helix-turn-helix domain-containing protein [Vicinamibacterales bacterium]